MSSESAEPAAAAAPRAPRSPARAARCRVATVRTSRCRARVEEPLEEGIPVLRGPALLVEVARDPRPLRMRVEDEAAVAVDRQDEAPALRLGDALAQLRREVDAVLRVEARLIAAEKHSS